MPVVISGEPPLDGGGPWLQLPRETVVAGAYTRVVLLAYGVNTPPAGTPVGTLLFNKGP